jgi:hypothetical protein
MLHGCLRESGAVTPRAGAWISQGMAAGKVLVIALQAGKTFGEAHSSLNSMGGGAQPPTTTNRSPAARARAKMNDDEGVAFLLFEAFEASMKAHSRIPFVRSSALSLCSNSTDAGYHWVRKFLARPTRGGSGCKSAGGPIESGLQPLAWVACGAARKARTDRGGKGCRHAPVGATPWLQQQPVVRRGRRCASHHRDRHRRPETGGPAGISAFAQSRRQRQVAPKRK